MSQSSKLLFAILAACVGCLATACLMLYSGKDSALSLVPITVLMIVGFVLYLIDGAKHAYRASVVTAGGMVGASATLAGMAFRNAHQEGSIIWGLVFVIIASTATVWIAWIPESRSTDKQT